MIGYAFGTVKGDVRVSMVHCEKRVHALIDGVRRFVRRYVASVRPPKRCSCVLQVGSSVEFKIRTVVSGIHNCGAFPPPDKGGQNDDPVVSRTAPSNRFTDARFEDLPPRPKRSAAIGAPIQHLPPEEYIVTNRGSEVLFGPYGVYPSDLLEQLRPGMNVLDVGCGGGQLVQELRGKGVHSIGVDPAGAFPKADYLLANTLHEAAAALSPHCFDRILCAWSVFSYYGESQEFLTDVLKVMEGLLANDGRIHLGAVLDADLLGDILLRQFPRLIKVAEVKTGEPYGWDRAYIELARTQGPQ